MTRLRLPSPSALQHLQRDDTRSRRVPTWVTGVLLITAVGCGGDGADSNETRNEAPPPTGKTDVDGTSAARGDCTFDVSYQLSPEIATVGIVDWSTDMDLRRARVEFGLKDQALSLSAPVQVESDQEGFRTLLLGMKGSSTYSFRIVAEGEQDECVSRKFELTTGPIPNAVPRIDTQAFGTTPSEPGFVITSSGLGSIGIGSMPDEVGSPIFIFDNDGDIVWYWLQAPASTGRALMDWEGQNMWMMSVNVGGGMGRVDRVSMDGLDFERDVAGLEEGHHDFTVLPGGIVAAIAHVGDCSGILERHPDGRIDMVVENVSTLYEPGGSVFGGARECHPNSILYHPADDTYTLSDRNSNTFVKFARDGTLIWQLGGGDPIGNHFRASWSVNHGHQVLENGNFLLFSNGTGSSSTVLEFELDESTWTATEVWRYNNGLGSFTLGDVQRLPGGNTLITYSNAGVIFEVDEAGDSVKEFVTDSLGYAMHRPSLYGPPPK